jgi:hypothetical protein
VPPLLCVCVFCVCCALCVCVCVCVVCVLCVLCVVSGSLHNVLLTVSERARCNVLFHDAVNMQRVST